MHIGKLYTHKNISRHKEVVSYYYKVTPINSLFASDTQKGILLDKFKKIILSVNMPGYILIKPKRIDEKKILNAYADAFKTYGRKECITLAKEYIRSVQEMLKDAGKYRYEIYFVFVDGRDEMKKNKNLSLFPKETIPFQKNEIELYEVVEQEIFKKMSSFIETHKVIQDLDKLHNYIAIPVEKNVIDYYVEAQPMHLEYTYQSDEKWSKIYTTTLVASNDRQGHHPITDDTADDIFNSLQLERYPTDIFVKFDLKHTKEFIKDFSAKKEKIEKSGKRYWQWTNRKDKQAIKGRVLAMSAENADESIEESKVRWQLSVRLRETSEAKLERIRDRFRKKFASRMDFSIEIGRQKILADNLFPYRNEFRKYIQPTDIGYLAQYNFLGGIYIGEEEEGIIESFTKPGKIPIFYDITKIIKGLTKTGAPTTVYAGETGGGKTQMSDHRSFVLMIFFGMRNLTIDPKGDREKKISMLGDLATNLKIGDPTNPDGMLDAFLVNKTDDKRALSEAKQDIASLARALNKNEQISFYYINDAYDDMIRDIKEKNLKQKTLTALLERMAKYDEHLSRQVLSLKMDPIARLFFANQDTKIDGSFNLNRMYNLVTFVETPVYSNDKVSVTFNPNEMRHAIFAICLSKVTNIVKGYMDRYGEEMNTLTFDENRVWNSVPGGREVVTQCVVTSRSKFTFPSIISQQVSDVDPIVLNNTGQLYVGSIKSSAELEYVLEEMKLDNNTVIKSALEDKTTAEGVDENSKYVFLLQDYNNRKSLTRLIMPSAFAKAFSTLKEEEKNVSVTDTNVEVSEDNVLWEEEN